jgi:tetratricopeptide (TPR) repeat protein
MRHRPQRRIIIERTGKAKEHFDQAEELFKVKYDYAKAAAEYSEVIKLLPNDAYSYDRRGCCYKSKQPEKAIVDFSKVISLNPEEDKFYFNRAEVYIALGENEKAAADIEKAVELAGTNEDLIAIYYYEFGETVYKETENKREAAVYFKKSIEHGDIEGDAQKALSKLGL